MNDNDVIAAFITILRRGLSEIGITSIDIKQGYQPRQVGTAIGPVLYFHKISTHRYGFPGRKDVYNAHTQTFDHTESIWRTPTFQVDGLSTQNPASLNQLTASDIVEQAADVLQLSITINRLRVHNIGIDRITTIREHYFNNDRDRFQQSPSFDFTLSYRREIASIVQPVNRHVLNIRRV